MHFNYAKLKKILFSTVKFNLSLTDEKAWQPSLWNLAGSQSVSGENVTESTALTYSAVWNAVNLYAGTISTLPLHLLRDNNNKTIKAIDKRLFRIMHSQFNKYMTAQIGREVMVAHLLTWGNCYAEKVYNGYGEIIELWPIPPNRVRMTMEDSELVYYIRVDNQEIPLKRDKILHIPGLGFDGFQGYSVISMASKSIGLGMALETFGSMYFGNGTHPGVIVSHLGKLDPITKSNLQTALTGAYSGLGKSHRLMLLEEGMKIENVGIPPEDSQFLESRSFGISEIARWFNLPPHKLKELDRATNNNIESEQISFVTDSILPVAIRIEQNFDMQLLSEAEKWKQGLYFRHNLDGLMRGNAKDRAEYYKIMAGIGGMTINEIRDKEGFDYIDNPYADEPFIAINNMIPLSKIDEYLANQSKQVSQTPITKNNVIMPKIVNKKKDNQDWQKIYQEGNAHWADDMQPSHLAQEFTQKLIKEGKKSILEIGCGNGRDSILFALAGLKVTAIDLVPEAIEIAKENAKNAGVEIDFQVGNAEKLQFADKSFDALFTLSVLHSTNMDKSIPEIYRVLKNKGMSLIYVYSDTEKIDGTIKKFVTVDEFVQLVKSKGFVLSDFYTHAEDEYDEAAEKHLIIISEVQK